MSFGNLAQLVLIYAERLFNKDVLSLQERVCHERSVEIVPCSDEHRVNMSILQHFPVIRSAILKSEPLRDFHRRNARCIADAFQFKSLDLANDRKELGLAESSSADPPDGERPVRPVRSGFSCYRLLKSDAL